MPSSCFCSSSSSSSSSALLLPLIKLLLILAFLSFTTSGQHREGEPCSYNFEELTKQRHITHCKKLPTLGAEFGWNYYQNNATNTSSNVIDILFRAELYSRSGWVAWGVNPRKKAQMVGTQAIIATKHSNGTVKVYKYNVTMETRLGCALIKPAEDIGIKVLNMSANWSNANRHSFYVDISATLFLPLDKYNISKLNHVWQVGDDAVADDDQIMQHKISLEHMDSSETINLTSATGRSTHDPPNVLRSVHGVLNIIGWGTLLPIGVIIARYFRVYPFRLESSVWKYLHVGFQSAGFVIGTIGWAIGLNLGNTSVFYVMHSHRLFGILIFTFSTLQMLAFRLRPKTTDEYRKYWNIYHHFLGYGLVAIIIINIFKGICILQGGPGWKWTYIGILILLGCITLAFEITTWALFRTDHKNPIPVC